MISPLRALILLVFWFYPPQPETQNISILFYNVENLFDPRDDVETRDEEFTPQGERHWTWERLENKLSKISKSIAAAGKWEPPAIIGLCETENLFVLEQLVSQPTLKKAGYRIIHKESPDKRGIDVAMLYREKFFSPFRYEFLPVSDSRDSAFSTREILYCAGITAGDTLHLFFNHWPSRSGGILETERKRQIAAQVLKQKADEISISQANPKIVILGDFNDGPGDKSICNILGATAPCPSVKGGQLYNLSALWVNQNSGTLKFQQQWSVFDQIIVSGILLDSSRHISCRPSDAKIFDAGFLLESDSRYGGLKPSRTYSGFVYSGGFSDHLPVYLELKTRGGK